jgi:RimJ/RimL family protein N-acetyltransferase
MLLRPAVTDDIPALLAIEQAAFARPFVGQWSDERHRTTLASADARYFVHASPTGELQAYVILRSLGEHSGSIELKRIVVATPGHGLGRAVLNEILRVVFDDLHAHRLYLDVFEDNTRARHLYESLGFVYEGTMREAAERDGIWQNLCLMSILETEYRSQKRSP